MDHLLAPPAQATLPVTAGCARAFTLQHTNPATNQISDYPPGVGVVLWIDLNQPTLIEAVIEGPNAVITIPATICDQVRTGTRYRVLMNTGALDRPLLIGRFARFDG